MLELLIVLALISLLAGLTGSPLATMMDAHRARSNLQQLYHLLNYARQQAVIHRRYVTVCPSRNQQSCDDDWSAPLIVFTDSNKDESINGEDRLLRHLALAGERPGVVIRASSRRRFLQFKATGTSNGIAGSVLICDKSRNYYPRKLVISLTGRISLKNIDFNQAC